MTSMTVENTVENEQVKLWWWQTRVIKMHEWLSQVELKKIQERQRQELRGQKW